MGDALIWQLVRKNNSFLVKRGGGPRSGNASRSGAIQLSCEPGNIMGVNSFKYSGLAKTKAVGIEQTGTDLSMDMKAYKKANLPSKSVAKTPLKKNVKTSLRVIKSRLSSYPYRSDLVGPASARYNALATGVKVSKGLRKGLKQKMGRN